jgi:AraC-like DNA-binding protein
MYFTEFDPGSSLAAHVSCYWHMRVDSVPEGYIHEVVPDGCTGIVVTSRNNGEVIFTVQGPRLEPVLVPLFRGDRFWGVRFWPDTGPAILGIDAADLRGMLRPALQILGPERTEVLTQILACEDVVEVASLFDQIVGRLIENTPPIDIVVRAAVLAIVAGRGEPAVSTLPNEIGLSQRQLQRRFKSSVGLTMKQFARIRRMRSAMVPILSPRPVSWSEVAADLGFSDQAHLIREFVALAGLTPTALADRLRVFGHGTVNP